MHEDNGDTCSIEPPVCILGNLFCLQLVNVLRSDVANVLHLFPCDEFPLMSTRFVVSGHSLILLNILANRSQTGTPRSVALRAACQQNSAAPIREWKKLSTLHSAAVSFEQACVRVGEVMRPSNFSLLLVAEGALWFALLILATLSLARWLARAHIRRRVDQLTGVIMIGLGTRLDQR